MKRIKTQVHWVTPDGIAHDKVCKTKKDAYALEREINRHWPEVQVIKSYI